MVVLVTSKRSASALRHGTRPPTRSARSSDGALPVAKLARVCVTSTRRTPVTRKNLSDRVLVAAGQRAHAGSVPLAAEKIMIERGRGRIESVFANEQINSAIAGLSQEGKIEAFTERHRDWLIKEPLN